MKRTSLPLLKRREFITLLGGVAIAIKTGLAPVCAQVKWNLVSAYPAGNFHTENLSAFAKDIADVTGGKLAITVYPNGSLFPATMITSAVRVGRAQIGEVLISLHEREAAIFGVDVVPFLATSYSEARRLWVASKRVIERKLAAEGLMVLFAVPWPPQGLYSKMQINSISDMRGLSWRVYNDGTQRIAQIVGANPVRIQAADLSHALATGLIDALMTSSATGYDTKAWETMTYFYDTQAWLPKNITLMNKAAFTQLDNPTQEALLRVAAAAEARGWWRSHDKNKWYLEQLAANGLKVESPTNALKTELHQIGERLTEEWLLKAGADGQVVLDEYKLGLLR